MPIFETALMMRTLEAWERETPVASTMLVARCISPVRADASRHVYRQPSR